VVTSVQGYSHDFISYSAPRALAEARIAGLAPVGYTTFVSEAPQSAKRILIADDQPVGRELIRTILESSGYEVIEAADGQAALEQALCSLPDLILLDLDMPERDGFSVVMELRVDPRFAKTPVIAVTAMAMKGSRQTGLEAGFTDYLTKPVGIDTLRRLVERLLASGHPT
jgi:CheY-like chemotaxis protein